MIQKINKREFRYASRYLSVCKNSPSLLVDFEHRETIIRTIEYVELALNKSREGGKKKRKVEKTEGTVGASIKIAQRDRIERRRSETPRPINRSLGSITRKKKHPGIPSEQCRIHVGSTVRIISSRSWNAAIPSDFSTLPSYANFLSNRHNTTHAESN